MSVRDPANGRVESTPPTQPPPWASFPSLPRLSPSFLHTPTGTGGWFSPLAWVGWNLGNYSFSRKLLVWASGDHCVCVCVCVYETQGKSARWVDLQNQWHFRLGRMENSNGPVHPFHRWAS